MGDHLTVIEVTFAGLIVLGLGIVADAQSVQRGTMIVFDLTGDGIAMTSVNAGVRFDLDGDGRPEQISWTAKGSDDAILVLDVNGNGTIDDGREVVGRQFRLPGWSADTGAQYLIRPLQRIAPQQPLPEGAGRLDEADPDFDRLQLWTDQDHDGRTSGVELVGLRNLNVTAILTGFARPKAGTPRSKDLVGNLRLFEGTVLVQQRGVQFRRPLLELEPLR